MTLYSPYDILSLDETAKPEDIKRKYRQLSLCEHNPPYLDLCDYFKSMLTKYDCFDLWKLVSPQRIRDLRESVRFSMHSHPS